jgi:hypothetical protein
MNSDKTGNPIGQGTKVSVILNLCYINIYKTGPYDKSEPLEELTP